MRTVGKAVVILGQFQSSSRATFNLLPNAKSELPFEQFLIQSSPRAIAGQFQNQFQFLFTNPRWAQSHQLLVIYAKEQCR